LTAQHPLPEHFFINPTLDISEAKDFDDSFSLLENLT
jgi:hypothetical protein